MNNYQEKTIPGRILLFADGNSVHTERWIEGLQLAGCVDIHLLSMNPNGITDVIRKLLPENHFHIIAPSQVNAGGGNWGYLANYRKIRKTILDIKPKSIVAFYLTSYGLLAALSKGRARLVQYLMGSDVMIAPTQGLHYKILSRYALMRADLLICSSETMHAQLKSFFTPDPARLIVQQYGVDDCVLNYPTVEKAYTCVSNRAWIKNSNIPLVLELFAYFDDHSTLALAGSTGVRDPEVRLNIPETPRIVLIDRLPYLGMIDLVAKSEFFFSLTNSDGASLSLMEAMAVGAIPIVSNIAPNREWVTDGVNGFLIDLGNKAGAARQIQRAIALDEDSKNAIRNANRILLSQKGSRSKNMLRFLEKLKTIETD